MSEELPARLAIRRRWQQISAGAAPDGPAALRVALLASYTIDPLVPYLGVRLHEAGLLGELKAGPYHQIVQQCADDHSEIGEWRPDVLVVAPRIEELGTGSDLMACAETALAAAARWGAYLVFVLPAIPDTRRRGIGDLAGPSPWTSAIGVREALRDRLARPNVGLADAEAVVRVLGSGNAHHPALFSYARIPYVDEVFAGLAEQLTAVLRVHYSGCVRAVILDADRVVPVPETLVEQLRRLRDDGVRIAVRASRDPDGLWERLVQCAPELALAGIDAWVVDGRGLDAHVAQVAALLGIGEGECVVVSGESVPDAVFDRPPNPRGAAAPPPSPAPPGPALTLSEYVAGLQVRLELAEAKPSELPDIAELVDRAKDLTLGLDAGDLTTLPRPPRHLLVARVSDRLGDYGISAAAGFVCADGRCTVDLFSVACPVLGKGIEERVLQGVLARAVELGCHETRILYRSDGRNQVGVKFARAAASADLSVNPARRTRVAAEAVTTEGMS